MRPHPSAVDFTEITIQADELDPVTVFGLRPHVIIELDEGVLPLRTHRNAAPAVALVAFGVFVVAKHLDSDPSFVLLGFGHLVCCHGSFLP